MSRVVPVVANNVPIKAVVSPYSPRSSSSSSSYSVLSSCPSLMSSMAFTRLSICRCIFGTLPSASVSRLSEISENYLSFDRFLEMPGLSIAKYIRTRCAVLVSRSLRLAQRISLYKPLIAQKGAMVRIRPQRSQSYLSRFHFQRHSYLRASYRTSSTAPQNNFGPSIHVVVAIDSIPSDRLLTALSIRLLM